MFTLCFEPLAEDRPEWGGVAIIPWDSQIFGFTVAEYRAGDAAAIRSDIGAWMDILEQWADHHRVSIISFTVPADDMIWMELMSTLGYGLVDYSLRASLPRLQSTSIASRFVVRKAVKEDQPAIEEIARTAFRFGRYCGDTRMPAGLAASRYVWWVKNAFADLNSNRVYILGEALSPAGFFHVVVDDGTADLRLGAVHVRAGGLEGHGLYAGTLAALREEGVLRAVAKISAANTGVLNLYAAFGFRFDKPEATFHRHSPNL